MPIAVFKRLYVGMYLVVYSYRIIQYLEKKSSSNNVNMLVYVFTNAALNKHICCHINYGDDSSLPRVWTECLCHIYVPLQRMSH